MARLDQLVPARRQRRHTSALLVASLLVAMVAAPAVNAQDASPSASAEVSVSPSASPTPLPEGFTQKMARKVGQVIEAVPPVRGLPAAEDVAYRVIDDETFREELIDLFREEYPEVYMQAEDDALTRLGFIGPEDDLEELILSAYEGQVLAYYDPATKTFSLIGPVEKIGPLEGIVVAHEYGHALQDAEWDLESWMIEDLDQLDSVLAQQALVEGDATAVMYDWAARELKVTELLRVSGEALLKSDEKALRRMPAFLRRQLEFPYIEGYAFVNALRGRGDWDAVDAAWDTPPLSTEQVLHPELYPDELPVQIELPDVAALLGPEWVASYAQTLGEMQTHVWVADGRKARSLFPALPAQLPRADVAAGWGGDRLVSLDGPDGAWVVVWQTDWDTRDDAVDFRKAARSAMEDLPGAHSATGSDVAGGLSFPVLVLVADSEETLGAVQSALTLET